MLALTNHTAPAAAQSYRGMMGSGMIGNPAPFTVAP